MVFCVLLATVEASSTALFVLICAVIMSLHRGGFRLIRPVAEHRHEKTPVVDAVDATPPHAVAPNQ